VVKNPGNSSLKADQTQKKEEGPPRALGCLPWFFHVEAGKNYEKPEGYCAILKQKKKTGQEDLPNEP